MTKLMRWFLSSILAVVFAASAGASVQATNWKADFGLGGLIQTSTGSLTALTTIPAGAQHMYVVVTGSNPVCYTYGVETGTPGIWPAGVFAIYPNDPKLIRRLKIVTCSGSSAGTAWFYFTRDRREGFNADP